MWADDVLFELHGSGKAVNTSGRIVGVMYNTSIDFFIAAGQAQYVGRGLLNIKQRGLGIRLVCTLHDHRARCQ